VKKFLKYFLIAAGVVVALAVLVIVFIVLTFDPNKYKPEIATLVKDGTGRTLAIDGNLRLFFFPSVGVAMGKTSLSEPNSSKVFAKLDEARVSLALIPLFSRQVVVDRVTLSGLAVDLVKRKDGKTNFDDLMGAGGPSGRGGHTPASAQPKQALQKERARLDIAGVEIRSSTFGWRDEASGSQLRATVAELRTGRIASGVPGKLSLSAKIEANKMNLDVALSGNYRLDFEKEAFALTGMELKVSNGAPGATGPTTSIRGDAAFDAARSAIRFELAADQIDVDKYFPPAKPGRAPVGGPAARSGKASGDAEEPIDLSALKGRNLKGSLKIDKLTASNLKAQKINLGLQAAGGKLDVDPLAANLYEGNLVGNASINANTNRIALKSQLTGVAVGPLLHDALDNDLLEGRGNVALDVQANGTTVGAMKRALSGSAGLVLRDGALKGVNLAELLRQAKALVGSKSTTEQASDRSDRTDFTELSASFAIRNGVAHNEDLSGKSPLLRLAGSGDVNIGANTIDYVAKVSVVGTSTGQGGREATDLRGVTVPVKISGPLDAPRYRADLGATAEQAVRQKAEEKVKEQLQNRLKDLLRR
jgi:AsmA protein